MFRWIRWLVGQVVRQLGGSAWLGGSGGWLPRWLGH